MKKVIYLSLFVIVSLSFSSCKKCVQNKVIDLKFTQDELRIDPYSGNERLVFIGSTGDSVLFHNGSRLNNHNVIYQYSYETAKVDNNGCQGDYFGADDDQMMMFDDTLKSNLYIFLNFLYSLEIPTSDKLFELAFGYNKQPLYYFEGKFKFNVDTLMNIKTTNLYYKDSIVAFHPTWKPGPNLFFNVYELYSHKPDPRETEWISTAYYSIKEGLVGFKTTFGTTWYLKK